MRGDDEKRASQMLSLFNRKRAYADQGRFSAGRFQNELAAPEWGGGRILVEHRRSGLIGAQLQ